MGFSSCRYDESKIAEKLGVDIEALRDAMSDAAIGSYATVWSVEPKSETFVKARISTSRKNKQTGEYESDFSGFVSFVGTVAAKRAASLKEKDRIKLLKVDVSSRYDKENDRTYTNYNIFDFETQSGNAGSNKASHVDVMSAVDDGEVEPDEDKLPF